MTTEAARLDQLALALFCSDCHAAGRRFELAGGRLPAEWAERFAVERARYLAEADQWRRRGVIVFACRTPAWRQRFYPVAALPPFLYVRSRLDSIDPLTGPAVAVVGSRRPGPYGLSVTAALVRELSEAGYVIVSGGARGVDACAHQTALNAGGLTAAVLGHGVDLVYPAQNRPLFGAIAANGWLISEYRPGVPPRRSHFPARNRLITALSDCLIVTSARPNSGTLNTAGHAADQGKPVFAVPGPILADESDSCHRLIREGAYLYTCLSDLAAAGLGGADRAD